MGQPEVKHTPGPWTESWDYRRAAPDSTRVIAFACGPQISCVGVSVEGSRFLQPTRSAVEQMRADARLIAAAPEMAELIADVGRWLEAGLSRGAIHYGTANRDGDLVSQIRAILARVNEPA